MSLPRCQPIIGDWNGTLLDDPALSIAVMNVILYLRQLPRPNGDRQHALFDFPVRTYYERLGFETVEDCYERQSVEFIAGYDARRLESSLHPETRRVLTAATAAGLRQSILSAYRQETLHEIVQHFGPGPNFDHIAGLNNIYAHSKLELGRSLVRRLALAPDRILLIGDTLHDLEVARALGVDCVVIAAGRHPFKRLNASGARIFPDLSAFAAAFGLYGLSSSGGGKI